jgi:hypothetical protein
MVTVTFGSGVNASLGGKNLEGDGGLVSGGFCADAAGTVNVQLTALDPNRVVMADELLEYAVAVAGHAETAAETVARRDQDAAKADAAVATMNTNLFTSELREHGEAFAKGCDRCRQLGSQAEFEACAQSMGTDELGRLLCHSPIR